MGRGLGWIDIHLLISALLSDVLIWTLDNKLRLASSEFNIGYCPVLWIVKHGFLTVPFFRQPLDTNAHT